LAIEGNSELPVEVLIESRTELWGDLSIDWTNEVPVEWPIEMPTEWWIELRIEVPGKVPTELPIELPSPESNVGLGCELWCELIGERGADTYLNGRGTLSPKQRRNRWNETVRDAD